MWADLTFPGLNLWNAPPSPEMIKFMKEQMEQVKYVNFKGFKNESCEFFPCHKGVKREDFNCLFCYCPLMNQECPGPYKVFEDKYGRTRKDCSDCTLNHDGIEQSWKFIQMWVSTSPQWDGEPQSKEKQRKYAHLVKKTFDPADIAWAMNEIDKQ